MENLEPKVEAELEFPPGKIIFEKPSKRMSQHLKPLFIKVHMDEIPINKVLVDNGAVVNILPQGMLKKINKIEADLIRSDVLVSGFPSENTKTRGTILVELKVENKITNVAFFVVYTKAAYNALLGRECIHSNWVIPSSLHQSLIFWNDDNSIEMMKADNRPFEACNNTIDAQLYNKNVGILKLRGFDYNGKPMVEIAVEQSL